MPSNVNPYEAVTSVRASNAHGRRLSLPSGKRVAWNAFLLLIAAFLLADSYSRFTPSLTRLLSRSHDDINAVASFARFTGLFAPVFVLVAFSTFFFSKRGWAIRLLFLIPLFSILMRSLPPRTINYLLSVVYFLAVSSILHAGVGWPILIRNRGAKQRE